MYHIFLSIISIFICYKFGDWTNWSKYYSTILFFILNSVIYALLTYNHPLWLYESPFFHKTLSDLLICLTVYPCTVMVFIPHFPKKITKSIPYITFWVALYSILEFISIKLGYFNYYNGWSIWFSVIANYIIFAMLILHYKKPLHAWLVVLISPFVLFYIMKIPYNKIR